MQYLRSNNFGVRVRSDAEAIDEDGPKQVSVLGCSRVKENMVHLRSLGTGNEISQMS